MASIILPILERLVRKQIQEIGEWNYHLKSLFLKAKINKIDYHYLLVPQALTVNFSFMFPAAAPTNAMVRMYIFVNEKIFIYL